jgi:parallel beta-helix repeat protein
MGRTHRIVLSLAAATALAAVPAPAAALATPGTTLSCGTTITVDTRLGNDLHDCPGIGIVIGADGVDLDLNGHTVDGDGIGDFEGINVDHHRGTSVTNGVVRDFVEGVALLNATDSRISGLVLLRHRHVGVFVSDSADVSVVHTESRGIAFAGIFVTRSRDVAVVGNVVSASGSGIGLRVSRHVRIAGNAVSDVDCGGIVFTDGGTGSVIESNRMSGRNDCDGITLGAGSDRNLVRANRVSGAAAGLGIALSDSDVATGNVLRGNAFAGVYVQGGAGNRIDRNTILANGDGSEGGVHLLSADDGAAPEDTVVTGNTVVGNVGDGIVVDAGGTGTQIVRNVADRNSYDCIDLDAPATTGTANTANGNGDLGIEAVPGTRGGANTASGNGDPRQCLAHLCR